MTIGKSHPIPTINRKNIRQMVSLRFSPKSSVRTATKSWAKWMMKQITKRVSSWPTDENTAPKIMTLWAYQSRSSQLVPHLRRLQRMLHPWNCSNRSHFKPSMYHLQLILIIQTSSTSSHQLQKSQIHRHFITIRQLSLFRSQMKTLNFVNSLQSSFVWKPSRKNRSYRKSWLQCSRMSRRLMIKYCS